MTSSCHTKNDKIQAEHIVGGNGGQAPSFATLCKSCAAVPTHLTFGNQNSVSVRKHTKCPFQVHDTVRYTPSARGIGLDVMSPPESRLIPGEVYRVAKVELDDNIIVDGHLHSGGGIHWSEFSFTLMLPARHCDNAANLPESSYGSTRVTLILVDGRRIHDVYLAWGNEIAKIGQRTVTKPEDLDFEMSDIINPAIKY